MSSPIAILLKTQAQREQDRDQIRLGLDCNSCSTVPLARPVDHRTDLELPAQREQDGDQIPASLDGDVVSPSTVPASAYFDGPRPLSLHQGAYDPGCQCQGDARRHHHPSRNVDRSEFKSVHGVPNQMPNAAAQVQEKGEGGPEKHNLADPGCDSALHHTIGMRSRRSRSLARLAWALLGKGSDLGGRSAFQRSPSSP